MDGHVHVRQGGRVSICDKGSTAFAELKAGAVLLGIGESRGIDIYLWYYL